jgi:hypothetical protein
VTVNVEGQLNNHETFLIPEIVITITETLLSIGQKFFFFFLIHLFICANNVCNFSKCMWSFLHPALLPHRNYFSKVNFKKPMYLFAYTF